MKIPYQHLIRCIKSNPSIEQISDNLIQLGHENEFSEGIFDIDITPNRGDCLSLNGILRDLSVFYDVELNEERFDESIEFWPFNFVNNAKSSCPCISFLKIEIEGEISPYKGVLKRYFSDLKINKNNFFTDVSNYISYETGQPTHCYESSYVDKNLILKHSKDSYFFETLLDTKIELSDTNLVFCNDNNIVNLAGIVGGKSTSCSRDTRSAIIECAYFKPEEIIGKSLRYGIKSDAAYKFERGVDPNSHENTLRRFIKIVKDHSTIKKIQLFSKEYIKHDSIFLEFDLEIIKKILGVYISKKQYENYLKRLGFSIFKNKIKVPSHRNDIRTQNDLAEEVARVIGYDLIPVDEIKIPKGLNAKKDISEKKIKNFLVENGFYEIINFPFSGINNKEAIKIDNPLDINKGYLRMNLEESLIKNLLYNERRQKDSIKLFEISDVYSSSSKNKKKKLVGIISSGRVGKNYIDFSKKISESYLSSILEELMPKKDLVFKQIPRESLDTKLKDPIIYIEFNFNELDFDSIVYKDTKEKSLEDTKYKPISAFPSSLRDLSFSIKNYDQVKNLQKLILGYKHDLLKEVFVFDYFKNEKLQEIKIGFRFTFQADNRTITDDEVSKVIDDIIEKSLRINSVSLPGLK